MIAPTMVSSFYEGMGVTHPTDSAMVECVGNFVEGKTGEIVWTFNRAGDFDFACLIAGHYQGGMVGTIKVVSGGKA